MHKKLLILAIVFIYLSGCNSEPELSGVQKLIQRDSINDKTLSIIESNELNKKIRNDTTLLGYRLGMNSDQFAEQTGKLISSGEIIQNGGVYYCQIVTDVKKIDGKLGVSFYNDSLWELALYFEDEPSGIVAYSLLSKLYKVKYGEPSTMAQCGLNEDPYFKSWWIKGNQKIELGSGPINASVKYIDIEGEHKWGKDELKKKMSDSIKTIKAI